MLASATQIALVKATLPRITKRPEQSAMAFRMHLTRYAPAMVMGRSVLLMTSPVALLADAIALIETSDAMERRVSPLAHFMRDAGLSPRGYMALHAALMDMVAEHLGGDLELEEAYSDVIGLILSTMLTNAHGTRSRAMPLAA